MTTRSTPVPSAPPQGEEISKKRAGSFILLAIILSFIADSIPKFRPPCLCRFYLACLIYMLSGCGGSRLRLISPLPKLYRPIAHPDLVEPLRTLLLWRGVLNHRPTRTHRAYAWHTPSVFTYRAPSIYHPCADSSTCACQRRGCCTSSTGRTTG